MCESSPRSTGAPVARATSAGPHPWHAPPRRAPAISYAYLYNAANQRSQATLADGSHWLYAYDSLGQVTSGKKHWSDQTPVAGEQFQYQFDNIGNRMQTLAGE